MATEQELRELKRRYSLQLLKQEGVSGVGIIKDDSGEPVLAIYLNNISPDALDLPEELKNHPLKYIPLAEGFQKFSR